MVRSNSVLASSTASQRPALHRSISVPALYSAFSTSSHSLQPPSPFSTLPLPRATSGDLLPSLSTSSSISVLTATAATFAVDAEVAQEMFGMVTAEGDSAPEGEESATIRRRMLTTAGGEEATSAPIEAGARTNRRGATTVVAPLPRPTRRSAIIALVETVVEEPVESNCNLSTFVLPIYTAPPDLTSDELNTLTQKNTKKNKIHFNKLNVETILMDTMRPPSPTSKIRKSLSGPTTSVAGPATKESREERANKRRGALRSSTDGSEMDRIAAELENERTDSASIAAVDVVVNHYRAAGDDEEYRSPVRLVVKKGKKKSSVASLGERKRVKWDKALVYEGDLEHEEEASGEGILKVSRPAFPRRLLEYSADLSDLFPLSLQRIPLDEFGNSMAKNTGYAKAASVPIKRMVYKDDE